MAAHRRSLRATAKEFVAVGLGGGAATIADMAALVALVESGVSVVVAAFVATACGAIVQFVWSKYLAFRDRSALALAQVLRYAGVALVTALLIALSIHLFAVELRMQYVLAKLLCSTLVFAAWTYPAQRYFVFTRPAVVV